MTLVRFVKEILGIIPNGKIPFDYSNWCILGCPGYFDRAGNWYEDVETLKKYSPGYDRGDKKTDKE